MAQFRALKNQFSLLEINKRKHNSVPGVILKEIHSSEGGGRELIKSGSYSPEDELHRRFRKR